MSSQLTSLTSDDILSLLDVCFQAAVFKHNDTIYKQEHGTPMGSPVSVVLAELTMQKLEKTMFEEAPYQPILWKRYLDDIFAILPTNQVDAHLSYLNSLNPYINFTIEREADSKLPFLDLLIHRNSSSRFSFSIYRKDTHTENYLKFNSNNPVCHKRAVAKSLLDRANRLCSQNELPYELQHIKNTLRSNGYPKNFAVPQNHHHHNPHNEPGKYISTPYIPGTSERVSKIFRKFNIVLSNKPSNTLFSQFNKLKDPIPLNSKSNVVYQLNCNECNNVYIGETKKQLKERTNQHIDAVRKISNLSLIFQHCQELNHSFNFDDPKILIQNSNVRPRKFLESFFTSGNSNSLNRCINFSEIYSPIITEITS